MSTGDRTKNLPGRDDSNLPRKLHLTVVAGPDHGCSQIFGADTITVGRDETADLRLSDQTVSAFHLSLSPHRQGIRFSDKNSRNGVYISGVRVDSGLAPSGCVFVIGTTSIRVELADGFVVPPATAEGFGKLVGTSQAMRRLYAHLTRLAATDCSVLIQGETGTGKELVARAIHEHSSRSRNPFVVVNCATLHKELALSQLFGHEKGAFTGATERKKGAFEAAHGGSLFLDEIGDMPNELQPILLRVLEDHLVTSVGSVQPRAADVRIICATWRDLQKLVNRETFRADLYHRIARAVIYLPALVERKEDIPLLIRQFLSLIPADLCAARDITPEAMEMLCARTFHGHVRELRNTVERLAMLADGPSITACDLISECESQLGTWSKEPPDPGAGKSGPSTKTIELFKDFKQAHIDQCEREYLVRLLALSGHNLSHAAQLAGLQRHSLRALLRKHGLYK